MTMLDLTAHFARFRAAAPKRINLAAHSHHDWPDVTLAAQEQCWHDAARLAGEKWDLVFGELIPRVQAGIARHLNYLTRRQSPLRPTRTNSCAGYCPAFRRIGPFVS